MKENYINKQKPTTIDHAKVFFYTNKTLAKIAAVVLLQKVV